MENARYALRPWMAEFLNPEVESDYRAGQFELQYFQVRLALLVWAALWMLFLLEDYRHVGFAVELGYLLLQRALVAGAIVGFALLLERRPALLTDSHGLAGLMILSWTGFLFLYFQRPAEEVPWMFALGMVKLIALFVFIPIRLPHAVVVGTYSILGTATVLPLAHGVDGGQLASAVGVMLVPMLTGLVVLYRLQTSQRQQHALLRQAQESNVELAHEVAMRRELEQQLREQATVDPLTGLLNRRQYEGLANREIRRARRTGAPLSLCVLDIDHFKRVNDTYGHGAGDETLQFLARLCQETARETDILGRLGGEEFVFTLPNAGLADALRFSDRLRSRVEAAEIPTQGGVIRVTVTIGVAELSPGDTDLKGLTRRADEALYAGKRGGRNQVCAAA
ncbi:MAG: GGDEF domain-containing protein [Ectothiorhodospiraceae bacterium]|nr:GGDEF domain-containing protein [Ectothiorhodospiraceae bacterium]